MKQDRRYIPAYIKEAVPEEKLSEFLKVFEKTGIISLSCEQVGISRSTFYRKLCRTDFFLQMRDAIRKLHENHKGISIKISRRSHAVWKESV